MSRGENGTMDALTKIKGGLRRRIMMNARIRRKNTI